MSIFEPNNAGTVTFTNGSTLITGSGTLFTGYRAGSVISIPGIGEMQLASDPSSDTVAVGQVAWQGATASGEAFQYIPRNEQAVFSAKLTALLDQLSNGNLQATAGLNGDANRVLMFTGPGTMTTVPKIDLISGVAYDVHVDQLADRDAYDGQAEGFAVLVADIGDGRAAVYAKASATSGDWSDPAYVTGPVGPLPDVTVGTVTTGDPGTSVIVTPTPTVDGVKLDFTIPSGRGAVPQGTYDGGTAYVLDDAVLFNGSTWIALGPTTGNAPPALPTTSNAFWQLLARQGIDGAGTVNSVVAGTGISVDNTDPNAPIVSTDIASQLEAEAGTADDVVMTPLKTAQAIAELSPAPNLNPNNIVNGSMIDSFERDNTLGTTNGYYAADQFAMYFTAATAGLSFQRVQSRSLAGSANQLELKCTTAKASLGTSDYVSIRQNIEGARPDFVAAGFGAAGAKQFVHRMQVTLPAGLYHLHVANSAGNRHCSIPFTATGVAEIISVVIPGDTSGTWLTADGTIGMTVDVVLAAGGTLTGGTASTWGGPTPYYAASTQFNILSSTSNVALLADVGIKLDPDATGVYGAYRVEVDADYRSERYYTKNMVVTIRGYAGAASANLALAAVFPVEMCKAPGVVSISATASSNVSAEAYEVVTANGFRYNLTSTASGDTFVLERLVQCNARLSP